MSELESGREETQELVRRRGDSFDIGEYLPATTQQDDIIRIIQNPKQLSDMLGLTEAQTENIRSLIVGAGTGGIHKLLSRHLGSEVSGMLGGFISGYVARKILGDK